MKAYSINVLLQSCLNEDILRIGQIDFTRDFRVFHKDDAGRVDLQVYEGADAVREIVRYDDAGNYRPLKTAPNLRHNWELRLASVEELRLALDFFYPAALGHWLAWLRNAFHAIPLRQTLGRQSGMYRVAARITDVQAQDLIRNFCGQGCLRHIGWGIATSQELVLNPENREIPLLCPEACHLYISEARRVVKSNSSTQ